MQRRGLELRFMLRAFRRFWPGDPSLAFPPRVLAGRRAPAGARHRQDQLPGLPRDARRALARGPAAHLIGSCASSWCTISRSLSDRFVPDRRRARDAASSRAGSGTASCSPPTRCGRSTPCKTRLRAGGLDDFTFDFISHSEVMTRCKPDPRYYRELLERLRARGEECLMIGNDPRKDLPAKDAGIAHVPDRRRIRPTRGWTRAARSRTCAPGSRKRGSHDGQSDRRSSV